MRIEDPDHQVEVGGRCCSFVMLAVPYDRRMGVAKLRGIEGSAAAPGHLEAIQGEVHHRSFRKVSGNGLFDHFIMVSLPLIEQEGDAEYG